MYQTEAAWERDVSRMAELPNVKKALQAVVTQLPAAIEIQKELVVIEAPSRHEERRAKVYAEMLTEAGLKDVTIDEHHNVYGVLHGVGQTGKAVLLEGHLDTVFSFGDVKGVIEDDAGRLHCPGICDDTRALAANWSVVKALADAGIETQHDIIVAGTVCEEGLGGMDGMRWLLEELSEKTDIIASISIDGPSADVFYANATGMVDWDFAFEGPGGHAWTAFGEPSAVHAACRAAAKLADLPLTANPKTTLTVSLIEGGQAVHAIASKASFKVNARSNSQEELEKLQRVMLDCVKEAVADENRRWGKTDVVKLKATKILDIPAGSQKDDCDIISVAKAVTRLVGMEPKFMPGGCTNANMAIARGIPAVTLGRGGTEFGTHTLAEWFDPTDVWRCEQKSLLMLLWFAKVHYPAPEDDVDRAIWGALSIPKHWKAGEYDTV